MGRRLPIHKFCLPAVLAALLCQAPLHAEDVIHDGEDAAPISLDAAIGNEDGSGDDSGSRSVPSVTLRAATPGAQLRDNSGKLLPPPNFRAASGAFAKAIDEARNPTPAPVVLTQKSAPAVEIEDLPTYTGGAPNPKIGFIGGDLRPEPTHTAMEEVAVAEAAVADKKVREIASETGAQIRSAIGGKIAGRPLPDDGDAEREKKRQQQEAERLARIGRLPASFAKPKLGATP